MYGVVTYVHGVLSYIAVTLHAVTVSFAACYDNAVV